MKHDDEGPTTAWWRLVYSNRPCGSAARVVACRRVTRRGGGFGFLARDRSAEAREFLHDRELS